jgi:hypothetical protein
VRDASPKTLIALAALLACSPQSWGWGHTGHVKISQLAIQALPPELPEFLRNGIAMWAVGELGAEADESKTTGTVTSTANGRITTASSVHDAERDPGHFINVDDAGFVIGGSVALNALPGTRQAFDTAQRAAVQPTGQTQYGGYLPYAIIDGFQQVRKDFGMWRAFRVGLDTASTVGDRAYFMAHLQLREQLIIRDIGYWSHFVADASQPMHVSIHYNGWGPYPNPKGFTTAPIHAPFEGSYVRNFVDFDAVRAQMRCYSDRGVNAIEQRVPLYLADTLAQVGAVYQAAKDSNDDNYATSQPLETAIVTQQLAAGAAELRDQIVDAWRQSMSITVGYPLVSVSEIEAGKVRITPETFGAD